MGLTIQKLFRSKAKLNCLHGSIAIKWSQNGQFQGVVMEIKCQHISLNIGQPPKGCEILSGECSIAIENIFESKLCEPEI